VLEAQERTALQLVALDDGGIEFEWGQRHAALNPPLELQELDVHVHGAGEFGVARLDGAQFCNLAGLGARRSGRGAWHGAHHTHLSVKRSRVVRR
jgi:hypothetical protein